MMMPPWTVDCVERVADFRMKVHHDLLVLGQVRRHAQLDADRLQLRDRVAGHVLHDERNLLADRDLGFTVVDRRDARGSR